MKLSKIFHLFFNNPMGFIGAMLSRIPWIVSDKIYIKVQYKGALRHFPNLKKPKSYTEKLQWLKLYDHNPLYTKIVDKITVKDYVKSIIGEKYIIPTLGVWDDPDDIDFDALPNQFVLKCNHTGGGNIFICKDKNNFDIQATKKALKKQLKTNTFLKTREWPYKNIVRKILCEQYMDDGSGGLRDYKFQCFGGKPKYMFVATNRFSNHNFNFYDMDFNPLSIVSSLGTTSNVVIEKPRYFEQMKEIVAKLCQGFVYIRVDLYYCNDKIYFGELTLYDASGFDNNNSEEWDNKRGNWIQLPDINKS